MRALIGDRLVDDETLLTVMCEVEKMINDRPLIRQCEDPRDLSALTPNTLLLSHRNQSSSADALSSTYHPREKWKQAQRLADEFWARWIKEYLPSLHAGETEVADPQEKLRCRRYRSDGSRRFPTWSVASRSD